MVKIRYRKGNVNIKFCRLNNTINSKIRNRKSMINNIRLWENKFEGYRSRRKNRKNVDWVGLKQIDWVREEDCAKGKTCLSKLTSRDMKILPKVSRHL